MRVYGNSGTPIRFPKKSGQGLNYRYIRIRDWLAWCAGIFDGEGYVGLKAGAKGTPKKYMAAMVVQKDPRLLYKFKRIVKMGTINGPHKVSGCHAWRIGKSDDILRLYEMLAPFLSPVKHKQFRDCFNGWLKQSKQYGRMRP